MNRYSFRQYVTGGMPLFLCFLCLCSICGCKKEPAYYRISSGPLRTAMTMHHGSYFIYEDSVTSQVDSLWVVSFSKYDATGNGGDASYETYFVRLEGGWQDLDLWLSAADDGIIRGVYQGDIHTLDSAHLVRLPFNPGAVTQAGNYAYHYLRHYDSLPVSGKFYKDVYETETHYKAGIFRSFFSLQDGLVRVKTSYGGAERNWELRRSLIIR